MAKNIVMPEPLKLKKNQKISYVNMERADNGGVIVRYNIITESGNNSQTGWDDRTEVYTDAQKQEAVDRAAELLKIKAGIVD